MCTACLKVSATLNSSYLWRHTWSLRRVRCWPLRWMQPLTLYRRCDPCPWTSCWAALSVSSETVNRPKITVLSEALEEHKLRFWTCRAKWYAQTMHGCNRWHISLMLCCLMYLCTQLVACWWAVWTTRIANILLSGCTCLKTVLTLHVLGYYNRSIELTLTLTYQKALPWKFAHKLV